MTKEMDAIMPLLRWAARSGPVVSTKNSDAHNICSIVVLNCKPLIEYEYLTDTSEVYSPSSEGKIVELMVLLYFLFQ